MTNIGIAGIGFMGWTHYQAYQRVEGVQITAICEQNKKRLVRTCSSHAATYGGKPWSYALIPHDAIAESWSLDGLLATWTS